MSDFLLRFSWVLFRPVGFCCRRPGFWAELVRAGLVLGWVGPGWVGPRMNWPWDGLFGFCARHTRGLVSSFCSLLARSRDVRSDRVLVSGLGGRQCKGQRARDNMTALARHGMGFWGLLLYQYFCEFYLQRVF